MKQWLTLLIIAGSLQSAVAQTDISAFFRQLQTFNAKFSQTVVQDGKTVQSSIGTVQLKKPLKFFWDYQTPEKMQLISDGKQFYHYDIELAQVTAKPIAEVTGSALIDLLSDKERLDERFNIVHLNKSAIKKDFPQHGRQWTKVADDFYQLTPKQITEENQATKVIIGLSSAQKLRVFYAEDAYGENSFIFNKVKQNQKISDKHFHFTTPKGVDLLGVDVLGG
ncbi:MAG: outer membrane lipoprotein carrier protein LolA [Gammaproteobacteria bacterium]|nr:MAG: outer membrane lipoprotein carrier protein LolA [Gammaproteobacteria bacterium]